MPSPRLIQGNPGTFNPNGASARNVRPGDVVLDLTGAVPGASVVTGAPGAFTLTPVGSALSITYSTVGLAVSTPGAAGTARVTATVKDPGPNTALVGAIVQLFVSSASAMTAGVSGPVGTVFSSVLDGDSAKSLTLLGITGAGGICDFEITGTAGANFNAAAVILDPLPSSTATNGNFKP